MVPVRPDYVKYLAGTVLLALCYAIGASASESPTPSASSMRFAYLVDAALRNNIEYAAREAKLQSDRQRVPLAAAALAPSANLAGEYNESNEGQNDFSNYVITAGVPLYDRASRYQLAAQREITRADEALLRQYRQQLVVSVIQARIDVQLAHDTIELTAIQKRSIEKQRNAAQSKQRAGLVTKVDVLQADAQLRAVEAQQQEAVADFDTARRHLAYLTGVAEEVLDSQIVSLPSRLFDTQLLPQVTLDSDEVSRNIRRDNHQLLAERARLTAAEHTLESIYSIYFPKVSVYARWDDASNRDSSATGGVGLSMPLYSGGAWTARRDQSQADIRYITRTIRDLEKSLLHRGETLYQNFLTTRERIDSIALAHRARRELLALVERGYAEGIYTTEDVLRAQVDVFQTEIDLRAQNYRLLSTLVNLRLLQGDMDADAIDFLEDAIHV